VLPGPPVTGGVHGSAGGARRGCMNGAVVVEPGGRAGRRAEGPAVVALQGRRPAGQGRRPAEVGAPRGAPRH
jgi:hypothetical protein